MSIHEGKNNGRLAMDFYTKAGAIFIRKYWLVDSNSLDIALDIYMEIYANYHQTLATKNGMLPIRELTFSTTRTFIKQKI